MGSAFNVEGTAGQVVAGIDNAGNFYTSGNTSIGGTLTAPNQTAQTLTTQGILMQNGGINSAGSVNVLVGTQTGAGGTAIISTQGTGGTQLSDITRDYMQYWECTTTGGATIVIGPAQGNATGLATIFVGSVLTAGTSGVISFRTPAGWYTRFTGTTAAFANPVAISC